MSVFWPPAFVRPAVRAAGLLFAMTAFNTAATAAARSTDAVTTPKVSRHPMSELKVAAIIPIGKVADWVAVTPQGVWVGSKKPNSVKEVDPDTNQVTSVDLPG